MTTHPLEMTLREIHLPTSISWWPLAPGWWILLFCVLLLPFLLFIFRKVFYRLPIKKHAMQALDRIEQNLKNEVSEVDCLADLSVLLRRVMLSQNSTENFAGVIGQTWLEVLDSPLNEPEFSQGIGQILLSGPYQREAKKEHVIQVIRLCRKWVKRL